VNKGFVLIIDSIFALILIISLIFILKENYIYNNYNDIDDITEIIITQKINDILLSCQKLNIEDLKILKKNYLKLFPNNKAYIKINNNKLIINENLKNTSKTRLISNSIKYIKSSNKEIYIEIGVYY